MAWSRQVANAKPTLRSGALPSLGVDSMAAAAGSGGETGSAGAADEAALLAKLTRTYGATIASASASSLDVGVTGGAAGVDHGFDGGGPG